MHVKERVEYYSDHSDGYTHPGTCTKSRVIASLIPRHSNVRKECLVSTVRVFVRKTLVTAFVNDFSHMARSSREAVYTCIASGRTRQYHEFLELKWLYKQSRIVIKRPVVFHLLRYLTSEASLWVVAASSSMYSIFSHGSCLLGLSEANGIEDSNYQSLSSYPAKKHHCRR